VAVPLAPDVDSLAVPPAHVEDTPGTPTIQTLVDVLNARFPRADRPWAPGDTLKNVLVMLRHPDGHSEPLAIGVPGDREVDPKRLEAQVAPAELEPFTQEDFAAHPVLAKGYIGPGVLGVQRASGIRFLLDPRVGPGSAWVTGADTPGRHVIDLVAGRDFTADGTIQAAEVLDGDPCPVCGNPLVTARGIEMGHIFQLGRKYADALGLQVLDEKGKLVTVTMGSYGVGVSRAVAAVAENSHDDRGLIWPREVAPADVHVVIAGKGEEIVEAAELISAGLDASGVRVILDDRNASVGVKFTDAELLGVPTICVVGRGVATGVVEVRDRATGTRREFALAEITERLLEIVRGG
jgi:prolyl-tRNA synthetase